MTSGAAASSSSESRQGIADSARDQSRDECAQSSAVCNVAQTGRWRGVNIHRMSQIPSSPVPVTLAAAALRSVTCPLCHTPSSLTHAAVEAGGEWQCIRCGQHWEATRLAALANYALWVV